MQQTAHKVVVIGHRNPDTDSICSAIAYAELKNKTSDLVCEARRAGKMNQETEFVLKKFGVTPPRMCTDVNPKIRDVDYRQVPGIPGSTSLRKAWEIMRDQKIDTLPVTSEEDELQGVITVKDIATANMDLFDTGILAKSRTSYRNILETLGATMVVGSEDAVCTTGHIRIGTATPEMLESSMEKGDIVILTNRYESQLCAIEKEASLIIICNGAKVGRTIQHIAAETGVAIMSAPCDTYAAAKLISQCAPISYYMTRDNIMKFTLVTPVADVTRVMAKVRHRYFPILDADGKYCGMISRRNIINLRKRRIILVDHNEATQAVEGFDQAEILEIIDHHRIGSLETSGPVYFRNQ
uniref:putative manganese-dependent inorganic diphosphatase n=1 Tax=Faecalibacterium prausnitzii TaxID=853 RepID=UPI004026A84A